MRYYISDCHFFHNKILSEMDNRDFESMEAMHEAMIENWNKKVRKNDDVVILGDFSWGNGEQTNEILKQLNGRLYLIKGNHDRFLKDKNFDTSRFEWVKDYEELRDNKRKVILSHYPMPFYNGQYRRDENDVPKTFMLHGHIHNTKDQEYLDAFRNYLESQERRSIADGKMKSVPANIINCFTQFSDYTPLTLDEWIEVDQKRRNRSSQIPSKPAIEEEKCNEQI